MDSSNGRKSSGSSGGSSITQPKMNSINNLYCQNEYEDNIYYGEFHQPKLLHHSEK